MGGSKPDTSGQDAIAREQLELQKEALKFQKEQALKLEQGKKSEEAKKAAEAQAQLEGKRQGRASTIKTIDKRPTLQQFTAQYSAKTPLKGVPDQAQFISEFEKKNPIAPFPTEFKEDMTTPHMLKDPRPHVKGINRYGNLDFYEGVLDSSKATALAEFEAFKKANEAGKKAQAARTVEATKQYQDIKNKLIADRAAEAAKKYATTPGIVRRVTGVAPTKKRELKNA